MTLRFYKSKKKLYAIKQHSGDSGNLLAKCKNRYFKVRAIEEGIGDKGCQAYGNTIETLEHLFLEREEYKGYREELAYSMQDILSQGEWQMWVQKVKIVLTILCLDDCNNHLWESTSKVVKGFLVRCQNKRMTGLVTRFFGYTPKLMQWKQGLY